SISKAPSDRSPAVAPVVYRPPTAAIIAAVTMLNTVAGGVLGRVFDHQEFPTTGKGLWFALQTVTTVGYGDVTHKYSDGRFMQMAGQNRGVASSSHAAGVAWWRQLTRP